MKHRTNAVPGILVVIVFAAALAACGAGPDTPGPAMVFEGGSSAQPGDVPAEYREMVNPLAGDAQAIATGGEAYAALCSQCHGPDGAGDGPAGSGMAPSPGNLADAGRMPQLSDGYLFWRISAGGAFEPYDSLMPAWGTLLSEREIWELVSYIRTLTP